MFFEPGRLPSYPWFAVLSSNLINPFSARLFLKPWGDGHTTETFQSMTFLSRQSATCQKVRETVLFSFSLWRQWFSRICYFRELSCISWHALKLKNSLCLNRPMVFTYLNWWGMARFCTSKVDFVDGLCRLPSCLNQQGFKSTLLLKSLNKFFKRHGVIIDTYQTTLREMRLALNGWMVLPYPLLSNLIVLLSFQSVCALFTYLIDVYI